MATETRGRTGANVNPTGPTLLKGKGKEETKSMSGPPGEDFPQTDVKNKTNIQRTTEKSSSPSTMKLRSGAKAEQKQKFEKVLTELHENIEEIPPTVEDIHKNKTDKPSITVDKAVQTVHDLKEKAIEVVQKSGTMATDLKEKMKNYPVLQSRYFWQLSGFILALALLMWVYYHL